MGQIWPAGSWGESLVGKYEDCINILTSVKLLTKFIILSSYA